MSGGFQMQLEDRGGRRPGRTSEGRRRVDRRRQQADSAGQNLKSSFRAGVPMIYADVDRVKAKSLGVPLDILFGTLAGFARIGLC